VRVVIAVAAFSGCTRAELICSTVDLVAAGDPLPAGSFGALPVPAFDDAVGWSNCAPAADAADRSVAGSSGGPSLKPPFLRSDEMALVSAPPELCTMPLRGSATDATLADRSAFDRACVDVETGVVAVGAFGAEFVSLSDAPYTVSDA
jgi:hypothetical protein